MNLAILSIVQNAHQFHFHLAVQTDDQTEFQPSGRQPSTHPSLYPPVALTATIAPFPEERRQLQQKIADEAKNLRIRYCTSNPATRQNQEQETGWKDGLRVLGELLYARFMPSEIQGALHTLPSEMPLILATEDGNLPWELAHDGRSFLALQRAMGRSMMLDNGWSTALFASDTEHGFGAMQTNATKTVQLIANATEDLPESAQEQRALLDIFQHYPQFGTYAIARRRATKQAIYEKLRQSNTIFHYSGHATANALCLSDGELSAQELVQTVSGHPFVFLNACSTADDDNILHTDEAEIEADTYSGLTTHNLAKAFLQRGSRGFVGTLWPIFDTASHQFAHQFYTLALKGMSVGEALRQTRLHLYQTNPDDPIWASYIFYGDPRLQISVPEASARQTCTILVAQLGTVAQLYEQLPFERAAELEANLLDTLIQTASRFGGTYHSQLGDTLAVRFGLPINQKEDAEHAVEAALAMQTALHTFATQIDIPRTPVPMLTIGISTGPVLAHHQQGQAREPQRLAGHVAQKAVSLSTQAPLNQIWVDETTAHLVTRIFYCHHLTETTTPPVNAYVVQERHPQHILQTPLVGRNSEFHQLQQLWQRALQGKGAVCGISGQVGVGKSHLVKAFYNHVSDNVAVSSSAQADIIGEQSLPRQLFIRTHAYEQHQPYAFARKLVRQLVDIAPTDPIAVQQIKLRQSISEMSASSPVSGRQISQQMNEQFVQECMALFSNLLGFDSTTTQKTHPPTTEAMNMQPMIAKLIRQFFVHQATQRPLLLIIEDAQWIDGDSAQVLLQMIRHRSMHRTRALLLTTFRPAWSPPWADTPLCSTIHVEGFDATDCQALLTVQFDGNAISLSLQETILDWTAGNPLYIEEAVRFLRENGYLQQSTTSDPPVVWTLADIPDHIALPDSLDALINTRIRELSEATRTTLHHSAVIGLIFEQNVLAEIVDEAVRAVLGDTLPELENHHHLLEEHEESTLFNAVYRFRHVLIQRVAYEQLHQNIRHSVHRHIADILAQTESVDPEFSANVAEHYYRSNDPINAIRYSLRTAVEASERWASRAANVWYRRVLEKLAEVELYIDADDLSYADDVTDSQITLRQRLHWRFDALVGQADALVSLGQSEQAIANYEQALNIRLSGTLDDSPDSHHPAELCRRMGIAYHNQNKFDDVEAILNQGLSYLDEQNSPAAGRIYLQLGLTLVHRAKLDVALTHCTQSLQIFRSLPNLGEKIQIAQTKDMAQTYNLLGIIYRHQGEPQQAIESLQHSIKLYEQITYKPELEKAYYNLGCAYFDLDELDGALAAFEKSLALTEDLENVRRQAAALLGIGEIARKQRLWEKAVDHYQQALDIVQATDNQGLVGIILLNLGAVHLGNKQFSLARQHLVESQQIIQSSGDDIHLGELWRYLAELHLAEAKMGDALGYAEQALNHASQLNNELEMGICHRVLGQVYRALAQLDDARTHFEQSLALLKEKNELEFLETKTAFGVD